MYGVGGSEAIARDMNTLLFSSTYKHSQGDFTKHREFMSSDLYTHHQNQQQQQEQQLQQSSALLRNRSAPGTFFASLLDSGDNGNETYLNPQSSSPESETIFAGFSSGEPDSRDLLHYPTTVMKHEATDSVPEQNNYSIYNTAPTRDLHSHQSLNSVSSMENSYNVMNSTGMEILNPLKKSNGDCSNLIRQSSSPAGFLSYLSTENEFAAVRDGRSNSNTNKRIGVEPSATTSRLSNQMSCSRFNPHSAENGMGNTRKHSPENSRLGSNNNDTNGCYIPSIPNDWNNSTSFNGSKRNREGDVKMFSGSNGLNTQGNGECGQYTPGLVHHMSLPKTSAEMAAVEKYLQFEQDTVPCKIRAKRGFATHPRSIAERVRRTRISERMRKLQELFPNMDKQANTADMLDMAVEYIKDLQNEVQTLKEVRSKCTCSCKQSPAT